MLLVVMLLIQLDGLKEDYFVVQDEVSKMVDVIRNAVDELRQIALRPALKHQDDYFDLMINEEEKEKTAGWQNRVEEIKRIKHINEYDPFEARRKEIENQARSGGVKPPTSSHYPAQRSDPVQHSTATATQRSTLPLQQPSAAKR